MVGRIVLSWRALLVTTVVVAGLIAFTLSLRLSECGGWKC